MKQNGVPAWALELKKMLSDSEESESDNIGQSDIVLHTKRGVQK